MSTPWGTGAVNNDGASSNQQKEYDSEAIERMCLGKKVYRTIQHAENTCKNANKHRGVQLRVYSCPCCGGFHLTSRVDYGKERRR